MAYHLQLERQFIRRYSKFAPKERDMVDAELRILARDPWHPSLRPSRNGRLAPSRPFQSSRQTESSPRRVRRTTRSTCFSPSFVVVLTCMPMAIDRRSAALAMPRLQERVATRRLPTRCGQQGELHGLFGAFLPPTRLQDAHQPLQGCGRAPDWGEGE